MQDLIIDLFAGGGGASEAIRMATGRHPDIAVNHNQEAIDSHRANHPDTLHLCEDIRRVNIPEVLARFNNRRVGLLWASPDCRHHSKAKGAALLDRGVRGLAWEVLRWVAAIRRATGAPPRMIFLENVEEFQDWCPIHRYGEKAGRAQKTRKGETFQLWVDQLRSLGAQVEWKEMIAANWGAPTIRKRLFLVARFDGLPIEWPETEFAKVGRQGDMFSPTVPAWRSAADHVIDWSIPVPSIFVRKTPLKPKTQARIAKGIKRFVIDAAHPFIVPITHTGQRRVPDTTEPLNTITGANRGEFALTAPTIVRTDMHQSNAGCVYPPEEPTRTSTSTGGLGVASAFLKPRYGERDGQEPRVRSIEDPAPTPVPTGNGGDLCTVFLGRQFGSTVSGRDVQDPHPAVMTDGAGGKSSLVSAHISRMAKGSVGSAAEEPLKTTIGHGKDAVTAVYMDQHNGDRIGRPASEPLSTATQRSTQQKLAAISLNTYYSTDQATDVVNPLPAATTKHRFAKVVSYLEQANTDMVGHDARSPVSTIVGKGCTQRVIEAALAEQGAPNGSSRRAVLEFLWTHFGLPTEAEWANPAATASGRLRFGLVILDGVVWQIVDIGMRMLVPRELFNAQGFRPDYIIDRTWDGRPITKTNQTRHAGNSVSPPPAAALIRVNTRDIEGLRIAA